MPSLDAYDAVVNLVGENLFSHRRSARVTQELRESRDRLEAIVEDAPDAIVTADGAGAVESFNPAAESMFGYGAGEAIGRKIDLLLPGATSPGAQGPSIGRRPNARQVTAIRASG